MNEITTTNNSQSGLAILKEGIATLQTMMSSILKQGEHYGIIPGCDKPSLLKSGAEKICTCFRLAPTYDIQISGQAPHREYIITCTLTHIPTQVVYGQGVGSCSSMESKYRYRNHGRVCPVCGKDTIIKGKQEYGGGWLCFGKKGGCGAKFLDNDEKITSQVVGQVDNPDVADQYNTILKMAKKRALVDAVLTATAASDIFTQDMEEMHEPISPPPTPTPTNGNNGNGKKVPSKDDGGDDFYEKMAKKK